jgi:hypothetical protein
LLEFGTAARREEGEYPLWIFDRRATPLQRQRSATLRAKLKATDKLKFVRKRLTVSQLVALRSAKFIASGSFEQPLGMAFVDFRSRRCRSDHSK